MKSAVSVLLSTFIGIPAFANVTVGSVAPDFTAKNQDEKSIHLADYKGHYVLLYFYPKDQTPGCTTEACALRDQYVDIKKHNAVILGVSRQGAASHRDFIKKHKLPFDLLVDEDGSIGKAYGVGSMPLVGFSYRKSILIGPDGKVVKYYDDVDPKSHAGDVLKDIVQDESKAQPVAAPGGSH